jgi:hypothetical protein
MFPDARAAPRLDEPRLLTSRVCPLRPVSNAVGVRNPLRFDPSKLLPVAALRPPKSREERSREETSPRRIASRPASARPRNASRDAASPV